MLGFFLGEILGFFIGFLLCACLVARKGRRIMAFELTEEELKKTRDFYNKIRNERIYDEKGKLINGRKRKKDEEIQQFGKCSDDDMGER